MTRKATRKKSHVNKAVKVVMGFGSDVPSYYVNHAEISNSPHDFTLTVGKASGRFTPTQQEAALESGQIAVEPMLQLVLPPTLIPALITALETQRATFESNYGPIRSAEVLAVPKS
jgi:hypothetical protein